MTVQRVYTRALRRCATLPDALPIASPLTSASSAEDENLTGCTPALRRRRQSEKYVTDASQLNLRFQRPQRRTRPISEEIRSRYAQRGVPSHLLGKAAKRTEESSDNESDSSGPPNVQPPPPPPSSSPPHLAENNARCRRFRRYQTCRSPVETRENQDPG